MSLKNKVLKVVFLLFFFGTIIIVGFLFAKILGTLLFTKIMSVVTGIGLTLLFATEGFLVLKDCFKQRKWPWNLN